MRHSYGVSCLSIKDAELQVSEFSVLYRIGVGESLVGYLQLTLWLESCTAMVDLPNQNLILSRRFSCKPAICLLHASSLQYVPTTPPTAKPAACLLCDIYHLEK